MIEPVRFKRAALLVADLDRSLAVYRDALGLTLHSIKESAADSYSYEIFALPHDCRLRMATLNGPADQLRTLALIEVRPMPPVSEGGPRASTVIEVSDLDTVLARLRHIDGVRLLPERTLTTHDGKVGREAGVIDPDNHAIVIFQL